ncbi:unnamed protein product [Rotaria socialis]|uniref:Uncharacterized protein n=1 Tax=Rotaria socialis TaxID=392032 RepID=A0A821GCQ1_9BILA|nr:unnamed protein product [Rotaria socialis]CAF4665004.1 unnamed protein product [Rotaria socialis]
MSSATVRKLHYFDGRGRAEAIRLILALGNEKIEENRYTFDEWPKIKPEMPLGQLPVLEIDGEKFPQSVAIARYLARQLKLGGKNDLESMKCDIIVDTMQEINEGYYRAWFHIKDEQEKKEEQKIFINEVMPKKLQGAEKLMAAYGNGVWTVGDNPTWADLVVYDTIENLLKMDGQLLDKHSILKTNREAVAKLPKLAEYLANRKQTSF